MGKEGKYGAFFLALALFLPFLALETDRRMTVALPADGPAEVEQEQETKFIALTFDDGPRRSTTGPLLDCLAQRGVPATFFLIGEQVPGNEDIVRRMEAEGHQIGIHTYDHKCLTALNAADFSAQVDRSRQLLGEILGRENFLLRPPYGMVDAGVERRAGSAIILWSIDPEDWDDKNVERIVNKNAERITRHIVSRAKDGDIILLHDIYSTSVEAALAVVDALHEEGFLFVTVEELAAQRHVELCEGQVYRSFYP